MAQEAPPTPQQEHYQQPSLGRHRSWPDANLVTKTALISAVVICVAALLVPWRLPTASPAKRAAAARSSTSARTSPQVYALPPILVAPPTLATLPFRKPKPRPTLHPQAVTPMPAGVRGDWTLKFDDEFNGTSLNTAKWSTGWYGSGITRPANTTEDDCDDPAQVSEGGGALSLSLVQKSENCGDHRAVRRWPGQHDGQVQLHVWVYPGAGVAARGARKPGRCCQLARRVDRWPELA